ncbi:MAG: beta-phosphoglucomutase family hydrolase, partial [Acidobacteriota bacterium]|nr:beta-phosphoglucomutase family hydrolase [Acidobacteriota bacterium]
MGASRFSWTPDRFDAALFDLDGVLTPTADLHAAAWKRTFDGFLRERTGATGEPFVPFDIATDYTEYVDGKPRYEGVRSFLASRGVELPFGEATAPPGFDTVCAIGNRKNQLVNEFIAAGDVEVYPGSLALVRQLRDRGIKTAVVSSSRNCRAVLQATGIEGLFDTRIDGIVAAERGLAGKPAPQTFLEAAKDLGVPPARAVVFEDAISGVEAGRAGNFGLVVGVDRRGDGEALRQHGA